MKQKKSTLPNMILVLFMTTLVSGLSLGYVNDLTEAPRARAKLAKKVNAINAVLNAYDNNPLSEVIRVPSEEGKDSIEIYPAFRDSVFIGAAVTGSSDRGYNGLIKLMAGFNAEGTIIRIAVLEQKETPGLGNKITGNRFLDQFRDQDPGKYSLKVKKDAGDIDALSGATISSRAFGEAAQQAYDHFMKNRKIAEQPIH
ncbi:RnfABCDGE type electron transport complex subunit G [Robiginitalea sp. IMCC44478]|uniref:RnfABCDGE type electron transport complex subunit G n=1 Tax=Robiginitalea sp. IMCC44478 TaxID=3459122 RepID=UPI00404107E3